MAMYWNDMNEARRLWRTTRMLSSRLLMTAMSNTGCLRKDARTRRAERVAGRCRTLHWSVASALALALALSAGACKTTAPASSPASSPIPTGPKPLVVPPVTWGQKIGWIVRLEDQRILRDPNPPPPVVLRPAMGTAPEVLAPPPPSDLIRLLGDPDARVRVRAALAVGRVGLTSGVGSLVPLLADSDADVRGMAAFALGLIGDAAARPALTRALDDASPMVQGRAAEALGLIGDRADAGVVAQMVQRHVRAGALAGMRPDDLTSPQPPETEAARLGMFALTRLGSFEALASAVLDANGQPVSRWWPIAFSLQRIADRRAQPALVALLGTPGRYTAAFAARGLGNMPSSDAAAALRR